MPLTQNNPLHSFHVILGTHRYKKHGSCVLHTGHEYSNNILLNLCYTLGINILIIFSVTWNVSTGSVLVEFMGIYKFMAEEMARLFLSRSTGQPHQIWTNSCPMVFNMVMTVFTGIEQFCDFNGPPLSMRVMICISATSLRILIH